MVDSLYRDVTLQIDMVPETFRSSEPIHGLDQPRSLAFGGQPALWREFVHRFR